MGFARVNMGLAPGCLEHTPHRVICQVYNRRLSVAHELSGLGSTRVVRFSASGWRRIDEPDDVATGPQDAEVSRRIEPVGEQGAVGYGGSGDSRVLRATVPALSGTL